MARKYLKQWFTFNFDGYIVRAQILDIEFDGGLGPVFLCNAKSGETFWVTRQELKECTISSKEKQSLL